MPARLSRTVAVMMLIAFTGSWLTLWPVTYGLGATKRLTARSGVLTGHVMIGPMTPVQREDEPPQAAPAEAFTSRQVEVRRVAGGPVLLRTRLHGDGSYRLRLAAGTYVVDVVPGGFEKGKGPQTVTVRRGQTTQADFDIDTGIR